MNKTDLVAAVAEKAQLSKKDTDACLSALVDVIGGTLAGGDKVQWTGFGSFTFFDQYFPDMESGATVPSPLS